MNTFTYVLGNPLRFVDSRGLDNPGMGPYGPPHTPIDLGMIDEYGCIKGANATRICFGPGAMRTVGARLVEVLAAATQVAKAPGQCVLGHFPQYVETAEQLGARYFNIPPEIWARMSEAERWAANQRFLYWTIARGDEVILSTPIDAIRGGSTLEREVHICRTVDTKLEEVEQASCPHVERRSRVKSS